MSRLRVDRLCLVARLIACALLGPRVAIGAPPIPPSTPELCASASEDAQLLRLEGRLRAARDKLLVCAQSTCPQVVRSDCQAWLGEVLASIPSIELSVRAQGGPSPSTGVFLDDAPLGRDPMPAMELDPGAHEVRIERAGAEPYVVRFDLAAGEKGRVVEVVAPTVPEPPPPTRGPGPVPVAAHHEERRVPAAVWILGGSAVVALSGFAYFGLRASSEHASLERTCAPRGACARADVDAVERKAFVADALLGVSFASAAAAGIVYWVSRPATPRAVRLGAGASPAGGSIVLSGTF